MSKCRFLKDDGTCAFDPDDDVREYCVAGPCSAEVDEDGSTPGANLRELAERVKAGYLYGEQADAQQRKEVSNGKV